MLYWACEVFMDDEIRKVQCPDCSGVVDYSFILAAHDGQQSALMLLASCPNCRQGGDERSLRTFERVKPDIFVQALASKLPIVLLR